MICGYIYKLLNDVWWKVKLDYCQSLYQQCEFNFELKKKISTIYINLPPVNIYIYIYQVSMKWIFKN